MIRHHPSDLTLAAYVAGSLPEAFALAVATHVSGCPRCQGEADLFERIGGAILESIEPVPLEPGAFGAVASRLTEAPAPAAPEAKPIAYPGLPAPLQCMRMSRWTPRILGIRLRYIRTCGRGLAVLLEAKPGRTLITHTPHDREFIAVLRGAHVDATGRYGPGDFAELGLEHTILPASGGEEPVLAVFATEGFYVGGVNSLLGRLQRRFGL
jgi:putative transcriptional regulator